MKRHLILLVTLLFPACASHDGSPGTSAGGTPADENRAGTLVAGAEPTQEMLDEAAEAFDEVRQGFLGWYYEAHPLRATELDVRDPGPTLPAWDRQSIQDRIDALLEWEAQLSAVPEILLRGQRRIDRVVLSGGIRAELLDLEEIRRWAADPLLYTRLVARTTDSGNEPLSQQHVPPDVLAARMAAAPALLEAARANLESPPAVWTERAISESRDLIEVLEEQLAEGGAWEDDPRLSLPADRLVESLTSHVEWLEETLLPRSTGNFTLGRYLLLRQLLYEEHVDLSVEELGRLNQEAIGELQDELARVAREMGTDAPLVELLDSVARASGALPPGAQGAGERAPLQEVDNELRRVLLPRSLREGWRHYRRQLRLDSLSADDPALELLRLQQALLQHARWDAALQLHAGGRSIEEVAERFQQIARVPEAEARAEVVRGTYDPMYLNAALGRLQILQLREDYEAFARERGESFSRATFDDRLLELGLPPTLAREILIPVP